MLTSCENYVFHNPLGMRLQEGLLWSEISSSHSVVSGYSGFVKWDIVTAVSGPRLFEGG